MTKLTRGGVAYDLNSSPFLRTISYKDFDLTFVFSSSFYLQKFNTNIGENRSRINQSLSSRFGFTIRENLICDLKLYSSIEKRGFLIYKDGERFECLNTIILDGVNLTNQI